jgi:hypothetical protein
MPYDTRNVVAASRYFLARTKSAAGEGVWRTIEGDQKIFISGSGEVHAGGPNGPVIAGKAPEKPPARKPRATTAKKPRKPRTAKKPPAKDQKDTKTGGGKAIAIARGRDSLNITKLATQTDDMGKTYLIADKLYLGSAKHKADVEFVNKNTADVSEIRKKLLASDNEDFDARQQELIEAVGKKTKSTAIKLETPQGTGWNDWSYENKRAELAAEFINKLYDSKSVKNVKVRYIQGRSNYSEVLSTITMDPDALVGTYVHELGHAMEKKPGHLRAARAMLFTLTKDSTPEAISGGKKSEITHGDIAGIGGGGSLRRSAHTYAGKTYGDRATEILSTGMQQLHDNPKKMARENPVYFDFMINLLKGNYE